MSGALHEIPVVLKTIGAVAGVLGVLLLLWLVWHGLRRVMDSPRIPMSRATYMVLGLLCLVMLAIAAFPLGVGRLLRDHARIDGQRTQVAEVRCAPGAAGQGAHHLSLRRVRRRRPSRSRAPGPAAGCRPRSSPCARCRRGWGWARWCGSRRWARPRGRRDAPGWLLPVPDVAPAFPMALVVRQARRVSLQAQPDAAAVYHLVASPDGLALHTAGSPAERPSGG